MTLVNIDGGVDFTWILNPSEIEQGTRICYGAESVAGHESVNLIEFTKTSGGFLVGVSNLTNEDSCNLGP